MKRKVRKAIKFFNCMETCDDEMKVNTKRKAMKEPEKFCEY